MPILRFMVVAIALLAVACKSQDSQKPAGESAAADSDKKAPDVYKVRFTTSKGDFVLQVTREWAPQGADRFYSLVKSGFYDEARFFRVVDGFMVQFGISGDPDQNKKWGEFKDDPVKQVNRRGTISFATRGPNTRTTQVFINFVDNGKLDGMGFAPFGEVIEGMNVVDSLYKGYGDGPPRGRGPDQEKMRNEGNTYLKRDFPQLDYIKQAKIEGA